MLYFTRKKYDPMPGGLCDAILTIDPRFKPFVLLYAVSGAGKSHTSREILSELSAACGSPIKILRYTIITTDPVARKDYGSVLSLADIRVPYKPTKLNLTSSRAHLIIETNKCFIIDLCGNESAATLGITRADPGWRQMQNINLDLLALRRFIDAMRIRHATPNTPIPFRDTLLNTVLFECGMHKSEIICVGCLAGSGGSASESNASVSGADSNTISFMQSIGYIPKPIIRIPTTNTNAERNAEAIAELSATLTKATDELRISIDKIDILQKKINTLI